MRLRPYGDSGALVSSFDALEAYFVAQGARMGNATPGSKRDSFLGPMPIKKLFRKSCVRSCTAKYLDYGTLEAMRRLHAEVRRDVARRELAEHVKLGPGGIREIEFIAQALQLIRGGRDAALTVRPNAGSVAGACEEKISCRNPLRRNWWPPTCSCATSSTGLQYLDDAADPRTAGERGGPRGRWPACRATAAGTHSSPR